MKKSLDSLFGELITSKGLPRSSHELFYPIAKNLTFLFKKEARYEEELKNYLLENRLIGENLTIFDIGANIGQYMLFFSEVVGPNGRVISFEPNPEAFKFLTMNKLLNNVKVATLKNVAVGSSFEPVALGLDTQTGGRASATVGQAAFSSTVMVNQTTLHQVLDEFGSPDFVKVDIEGGEIEVFQSRDLLKRLTHTTFMIEVRSDTKHHIFEIFQDYDCFCSETNSFIQRASQIPSFANLFFTPRGNTSSVV